jgi:hypothetical protein
MNQKHHSIHTILKSVVCAALALWVLMAAPTGWLYDLWAGVGTEQGQRPSEDVQQLRRREDVEAFFWANTPATVTGDELAACPLARLRDVEQEGTHYHRSYGTKRAVFVAEYIFADYPLSSWQRMLQGLAGGFYNRYYLMELEDSSYLCIYFDDYLTLTGAEEYPTGYIRYTSTEERRMLNQMSEDYDVDSVYVLDMYQHGKVNWMLDVTLRLAVLLVAGLTVLTVREFWKRRIEG